MMASTTRSKTKNYKQEHDQDDYGDLQPQLFNDKDDEDD
jgi:hypothetical protein